MSVPMEPVVFCALIESTFLLPISPADKFHGPLQVFPSHTIQMEQRCRNVVILLPTLLRPHPKAQHDPQRQLRWMPPKKKNPSKIYLLPYFKFSTKHALQWDVWQTWSSPQHISLGKIGKRSLQRFQNPNAKVVHGLSSFISRVWITHYTTF